MKKTKIIATISDINFSEEKIVGLYNAWANILRFNFSHAEHKGMHEVLEIVRKLNATGKINMSTLLDTKWPEIRTGNTAEKIVIQKWKTFRLFVDQSLMNQKTDIFCDYPYILQDMSVGKYVIIDSWLLKARVVEITKEYLLLDADIDHTIWSRRHINLPWIRLNLPWVTEKDKEDILFGINEGMDFIAASFIRHENNIQEIRDILKEHNAEHIQIISKIENQEALDNLEWIVKNSDAIMVARGDLGVEIDIASLPHFQKIIMKQCFVYGKTIIVATELLKSMVHNQFPTRAEVSDVYNSVVLRTDCLMLSDETAVWDFPIQSCQMMANVALEAESHITNKHKDFEITFTENYVVDKKVIARSALMIADDVQADYILLFTNSGFLARIVSGFKPNHRVFAFTKDESVVKSMNILFGVYPFLIGEWSTYPIQDEKKALEILLEKKMISSGNKIVIINDVIEGNATFPYVKIVIV